MGELHVYSRSHHVETLAVPRNNEVKESTGHLLTSDFSKATFDSILCFLLQVHYLIVKVSNMWLV